MFIAAVGVVGGIVVLGAAAHEDHHDYSKHHKYSEYSDGNMRARISEKEAQVQERKSEVDRLRRLVRETVDDEIANLRSDSGLAPYIPSSSELSGSTGTDRMKELKSKAAGRMKQKLAEEVASDEEELRQIDLVIGKINAMRLEKKS